MGYMLFEPCLMDNRQEKDRGTEKGKGKGKKKKGIYVGRSMAASGIWEVVGKAKKYAGHFLRFSCWA